MMTRAKGSLDDGLICTVLEVADGGPPLTTLVDAEQGGTQMTAPMAIMGPPEGTGARGSLSAAVQHEREEEAGHVERGDVGNQAAVP